MFAINGVGGFTPRCRHCVVSLLPRSAVAVYGGGAVQLVGDVIFALVAAGLVGAGAVVGAQVVVLGAVRDVGGNAALAVLARLSVCFRELQQQKEALFRSS